MDGSYTYLTISHRDVNFNYTAFTDLSSDYTSIPNTTYGFKKTFRKIFNYFGVFNRRDIIIQWLGQDITIKTINVFESDIGKIESMQHKDIIFVFCLHGKNISEKIEKLRNQNNYGDTDIVKDLYQSLSKLKTTKPLIKSFENLPGLDLLIEPPGFSLWSDQLDECVIKTFPYIYTFYYYGWLIFQRLERRQVDLELSNNLTKDTFKELQDTIEIRILIINIQRYFLTFNRSKSECVKKYANMLREKMKLDERFDRHLEIHLSFEKHLDNISKIAQTKNGVFFKNTSKLLINLGVPIGIISTLMALSTGADIINNPNDLIYNPIVIYLVAISFLIPISLISIAKIIDYLIRKKNNDSSKRLDKKNRFD